MSIYFTISPVKHLRDGIIENSQSKSRLVSALHTFLLDNSDCFYFPSLEIVQEELRDYRYYANDLAHPSEWTINYIFERWLETYFDDQNQKQMELLKKEFSSKNHRPMS